MSTESSIDQQQRVVHKNKTNVKLVSSLVFILLLMFQQKSKVLGSSNAITMKVRVTAEYDFVQDSWGQSRVVGKGKN